MKQRFYILLLLIFMTSCGNSQTTKVNSLSGDIKTDLKALLPLGKVNADIMDGVLQNPRKVELTKKFQSAIQNNYEWFVNYMKTVPEGQPMPYNSKLGLTKDEYTELLGFIDNVEVVSTGKEDIEITSKDDIIYLKSKNKLADLDSLTIDLKNNTINFKNFQMVFSESINVTNDKNGLKSKWSGYNWKFENPKNIENIDLKDLSKLNIIQYKVTIGRLEKNGKTYMSLKGREIQNGVKTVEFELPIQF